MHNICAQVFCVHTQIAHLCVKYSRSILKSFCNECAHLKGRARHSTPFIRFNVINVAAVLVCPLCVRSCIVWRIFLRWHSARRHDGWNKFVTNRSPSHHICTCKQPNIVCAHNCTQRHGHNVGAWCGISAHTMRWCSDFAGRKQRLPSTTPSQNFCVAFE